MSRYLVPPASVDTTDTTVACFQCRQTGADDHHYLGLIYHIHSRDPHGPFYQVELSEDPSRELSRCSCPHGRSRKPGEPSHCWHIGEARKLAMPLPALPDTRWELFEEPPDERRLERLFP